MNKCVRRSKLIRLRKKLRKKLIRLLQRKERRGGRERGNCLHCHVFQFLESVIASKFEGNTDP